MAPNKKKKKAVSNPSRGFATISHPSKKIKEEPEDIANDKSSEKGQLPTAEETDKPVVVQENDISNVQSMSPEELEDHLERAEIQTFLETAGPRIKAEVRRQTVRAQAERRNIRREAKLIETETWLAGLTDEILELERSSVPVHGNQAVRSKQSTGDDLLSRLWAVQQVLKNLNFGNIDTALKHLVGTVSTIPDGGPSLLWGLEESLTWLALESDPVDLPPYTEELTGANSSVALQPLRSFPGEADSKVAEISHFPNTNPDISRPTVEETVTAMTLNDDTSHSANGTCLDTEINSSTDDSDNYEPEQLQHKWLEAKQKLFKTSLEDSGSQQQRSKLTKRIQSIERDVLFDRHDAAIQWALMQREIEIDYAKANAEAKRTCKHEERISPPVSGENLTKTGEHKATDSDMALQGDLFVNMFDTEDEEDTGHDTTVSSTVTLLSFGALGSGLSPRRLLEEHSRARDHGSRVSLRSLRQNPQSSQHSVEVRWSTKHHVALSPSFLPSKLSYDFQPRSFSISMESVAASSPLQSEGYVCTIMLFVLSQLSNDEKLYLRLQTVWRDLWKELLDIFQQEADRLNVETLKHIKGLIAEEQPVSELAVQQMEQSKLSSEDCRMEMKLVDIFIADETADSLKATWQAKSTTPKYQKMLVARQKLPIWKHRREVVDTLNANQVTVLCAETGAGKSTQLPSFVLEEWLSTGRRCNILITQPRRISAISLAQRVSEELGEQRSELGKSGSLVGYAIRLESKVSAATRIRYITTGVLLRMFENNKNLDGVTCLFLDEVHERTMDLDLLFIAVRRLLKRRHDLKVILMSATVDAEKFSQYFGGAPILNISGRSFPVEVKFLEDAVEVAGRRNDDKTTSRNVEAQDDDIMDRNESERVKSLTIGLEAYSSQTRKVLAEYDEYKIDYSLIVDLVTAMATAERFSKYSKAILIFMPGIGEIRRLHQLMLSFPNFQSEWVVHLLHSSFSNEDLERAFEPAPGRHKKIVIATNIAETGITIPDVTAVIDTCREKIMRFDERRQLSRLTDSFVSRSSARQRRGRAARVQAGLCFHLVTRYRHDHLMLEEHVPEMLRLSLQDPILRIKIWNLGDIEQTMAEAFDPPPSKNLRRAIQLLKDVRALTENEALTSLGRQLAQLPLDIWLGKLVLYGVTFACLDATAFIAAMLSSKSPFLEGSRNEPAANAARIAFNKSGSDLLVGYRAYCGWRSASVAGKTHDFCRKNCLEQITLNQIEDQKMQLLTVLSDVGIISLNDEEQDALRQHRPSGRRGVRKSFFTVPERYNYYSDNDFAMNSVMAMSFYPKLLMREGKGWRNVANNQHVAISPKSVNHLQLKSIGSLSAPDSTSAGWLSFYQTLQTSVNQKKPTVFETSPVSECALAVLVGNDADFRMYAGAISIDGGRIRFTVRDWKTMAALKALRRGVQEAIRWFRQSNSSRQSMNTTAAKAEQHRRWLEIWQRIVQKLGS